ncbi:1305_t:CDS:2, partial [Ambispora leptoticha]
IFLVSFIYTTVYSIFKTINPPSIWKLTIIHTNDVHSRYDQINEAATDCSPEQFEKKQCYGGIARHKTVIDKLRRENKNSLLLDGGDQFQGTLFFTYYNGTINSEVMNLLEYNITAIGNHEFDKGPKTLA